MIKFIGSPNFDTNRKPIDTIFIHWIVGTLASADAQFQKTGGTSAHYGIEDDTIHQYVKEEHVAYHAGVYSWNQRSIGIEHSADPDRLASDKTYETAGKLIAEISKRHAIPLDREHIKGHKEVRATQCPGTMDIERLINIARQYEGDTIQIEKKTFENLVNKSSKYDEFVNNGYDTVQKIQDIIEGHKSRATDFETQLGKAWGDLAVEKEKTKQVKQELADYRVECEREKTLLLNQIDELSKDNPEVEKLRAEYEGMLRVERGEKEKIQKKLNDANKEIAKLKGPLPIRFIDKLLWLIRS